MESPSQTKRPEDYWEALKAKGITPNFWMTEEYVQKAELVWNDCEALCGWTEPEEYIQWKFPPLSLYNFWDNCSIWASFPDVIGKDCESIFLDHQYLYEAKAFLSLTGHNWAVYRKNIKKYPARNGGTLEYRRLKEGECEEEISQMLLKWAKGKTLYDNDVMVKFLLQGNLRWGLFRNGELAGVNVGDKNYLHAVYRYCLDDGTPYLNEYLRHCFYTSDWVQKKSIVNDGGDLGNPELERFKLKLNPVLIQKVYTYITR